MKVWHYHGVENNSALIFNGGNKYVPMPKMSIAVANPPPPARRRQVAPPL
ncbi:hypothetical protein FACS1894139_18380 [Planctomycetales bacterium]|nr:hypothetical protein FACS1894139_18380 [Planctomycetales bacterium]